ncbi:uncharacterized protein Z518_02933 [Rhinocladiella mackenziei CBS 650.93]|uniref:Iron-sulfur cluster assembly factor IBA57 homolog, mitochondrial n=1 Tax=Rhinocladiella mackenziei CBS 650.93 TaxID=1442369 RepID=A0A0D2G153_9EURO|nr:uncharacterized protein Z518_02933 [Rhinocladiella mackenziei CBS 650.93]KIX08277.1 hypothetical protein Z518_02933 [Rhinocladiella mackenziei CBS 650.93]
MPPKPKHSPARPFIYPIRNRSFFEPQLRSSNSTKYLRLTNRTLVRLAGCDAKVFLNDLIPAKILDIQSTNPIYTAFLSAHGRILNDVFIYPPAERDGEEWFIEVDSVSAGDLISHFRKHKLRAQIDIEKLAPEKTGVYYRWPSDAESDLKSSTTGIHSGGQDPRPGMGMRWLDIAFSEPEIIQRLEDRGGKTATLQDYAIHRMLNGVAEGQSELIAKSALPQESNIDLFGGIDFHKGCYVGQELTIRTHHTGVVRKRILPCQLYNKDNPLSAGQSEPAYKPNANLPLPPAESNISKLNARGRGRSSGKWLGGVGNIGLALCRLEMMTDIQLTADRTNYDPNEEYKVTWEVEGEEVKREVMLKPFVPQWLRDGVEQSLRRKEKKPKPRQAEEDDYEEVD